MENVNLQQALIDAGRKLKWIQKAHDALEAAILAEQLLKELAGQNEVLTTSIVALKEELTGLQGQAEKIKADMAQAQAEAKEDLAASKQAAALEFEAIQKETRLKKQELEGVAGRLDAALVEMDRQIRAKTTEADREEKRLQEAREALAKLKEKL